MKSNKCIECKCDMPDNEKGYCYECCEGVAKKIHDQWCDICNATEHRYKTYCKHCNTEHFLCSSCYELGHNWEGGLYWEVKIKL